MASIKKVTKVAIPVAGKGTRMMPLTKAVPKELIALGKKPVLEHILDECISSGINDILLITAEGKEAIQKHFGYEYNGAKISYTIQKTQSGLANAIYCAKKWANGKAFAIALGDCFVETEGTVTAFKRMIDAYAITDAACMLMVEEKPYEELGRFGVVKPKNGISDLFEVDGLVEKPNPADAPSPYIISGRYIFSSDIFNYIEKTPKGAGGEYQIADSMTLMMKDGYRVWCLPLTAKDTLKDVGTFDSYFEAFAQEIEKYKRSK